jgi:GNAT superfamily N-acetyltransferase
MTQRISIEQLVHLAVAENHDFPIIADFFAALHHFNTGLDARFALADGWEPLLREHFARTHTAPGALWLLAWAEGRPVGMLLMESHEDSPLFAHRRWAELVALYVAEEQRGSRLGVQLVEEARRWAAAKGFDRIQLYVTASNERARRFYARCGLYPTQEIWRADLTPHPDVTPPPDPSCDHSHPEPGHHHLAVKTLVGLP